MKINSLWFLITGCAVSFAETSEWRLLFNGENLDGWTTILKEEKPGKDPDKLVQVHDGMIHLYRDAEQGSKVPFGVITHEDSFTNFHLRFEYRWVGKRFAPRAEALRDSGMLYHGKDETTVWPESVEYQIQEGDTADLVFIRTGGLTWLQPDEAASLEGQGDPGLLPEFGGTPSMYGPAETYLYVGRFEEADSPSGWNRGEAIVHGADYAEHIINGRTIARLTNIVDSKGEVLGSGKISFQLEGAEMTYRNIEIRELDPPAKADRGVVSFSGVKEKLIRTQSITVANPGPDSLSEFKIVGKDADAFEVIQGPKSVAPNESGEWTIAFHPLRGRDRYSAGLTIGSPDRGAFVILQGLGMDAFEGENEPPLQDIVYALGIPLDVGGIELKLDKDADVIGDGIQATHFKAVTDGKVRITPVARFSPVGRTPFGIFRKSQDELIELGKLTDSKRPKDAHQCLLPPIEGETSVVELTPPNEAFGFFLKGPNYTSSTVPNEAGDAKIKHTARVFPVSHYQGNVMEDTWLICFEEASNGDYQDAVFLVEGVTPESIEEDGSDKDE